VVETNIGKSWTNPSSFSGLPKASYVLLTSWHTFTLDDVSSVDRASVSGSSCEAAQVVSTNFAAWIRQA